MALLDKLSKLNIGRLLQPKGKKVAKQWSKFDKKQKKRNQATTITRQSTQPRMQIVRFRPNNFEKYAVIISKHLLSNNQALVDYSLLSATYRQRLIDFLCGVIYCIGGKIEKKDSRTYFITPALTNSSNNDSNQLQRNVVKRCANKSRTRENYFSPQRQGHTNKKLQGELTDNQYGYDREEEFEPPE